MEYAHLSRSGLQVSRIALGAMNFGDAAGKDEAFEVLARAFDLSINHIDTADVYGGPQTPDMIQGFGTSEEIIGEWLQHTGRRDEIVLDAETLTELDRIRPGPGVAPQSYAW